MFGQGGTIFRKATVQQIMHILGASAPECGPKQNIAGYENNGSIQQTSKKNLSFIFRFCHLRPMLCLNALGTYGTINHYRHACTSSQGAKPLSVRPAAR
jgi:hypothetical protein